MATIKTRIYVLGVPNELLDSHTTDTIETARNWVKGELPRNHIEDATVWAEISVDDEDILMADLNGTAVTWSIIGDD